MERLSLWGAFGVAVPAAVAFAWSVRLPLPFDGFAALSAGGLACVTVLALTAWMPRAWVWSDAERLRHAFQARHDLSAAAADVALAALSEAHTRAVHLRNTTPAMRQDIAAQVTALADRFDAAAREIFYTPDRHRALRPILVRSDLVVEAARAHARLRGRDQQDTETASRAKLLGALEALETAFDHSDLLAARGLLQDVEIASDVAERLLTPRRPLRAASSEQRQP